jgi:hypothetical protein
MKIKFLLLAFIIISLFYECNQQNMNEDDNSTKKYALKGLVTMGSTKDLRNGEFNVLKEVNAHPDIYSGVVIKVTWKEIEPQRGVFDFSSIQNALLDIRNYNNTHPNNKLGAKLRVSATINPSIWVLNLADGSVEIVLNQFQSLNIGVFWTREYRQAWHELQIELSNTFDLEPLLQEVCITYPTMVTDEPFVSIFNQATIQNLQSKGFTDTAFKQALEGTIDDYSCWKKTLIDFSFNMYREIDTGVPVNNIDFTTNLMRKFKNQYKERAVLSNHGLREELTSGAKIIYQTFLELQGNISIQTKSPNDLTDESFRVGISYGVSEFEIWDSIETGGYANFNINDLKRWQNLITN